MKDEIKEIDITKDLYLCSPLLNTECSKENCYINNGPCCHTVNKEHSQQHLLDYITNLQEETERQSKAQVILDDENAELQGKITELQEENERYKNIVDETFNYCKEQQEKSFDVVAEECYAEVMYFISQKKEELKGE